MLGKSVNDQMQRMDHELIVAYFKVLPQNFPGGTEENHEILSQDNRSPGWVSNRRPPNDKPERLSHSIPSVADMLLTTQYKEAI
jgi:hypothetical protein